MIEKIEIQNYKSIRSLDLKLSQRNILIGANGVGKSNFISFFKFVNQIYEGRLQEYAAKYGVDSLLYLGRKKSNYISTHINFDNIKTYYFSLSPTLRDGFYFNHEGDYFNNRKNSDYNYDNWHNQEYGSKHIESKLKSQFNARAYYTKDNMESFKVYHFHDTSEASKMKQSSSIYDNQYFREDASNLATYLYLLQEIHPKSLKRIERTVQSIAPFFKSFDLKPNKLQRDSIKLEWNEKGTDMYLDAHHLSDGTLRFIALATLLMQPNLPPTIIIDEPELGLHPAAIVKLAALIKKASAKSQVIISTQSINLIDQFEPEDIITVDRKDGQSVFNRQSSEHLSEWLNAYSMSDLWDKNVIGGRP